MTVYFDSSVFLSILSGDSSADKVRKLLDELQQQKVRIYTSIITIQEVSVGTYRAGTVAKDHFALVRKLARIEGVTRDVAVTAAKLEAQIIDGYKSTDEKATDNKRRKWDCFHIATAQCLACSWLFSFDGAMLKREAALKIKGVKFSEPESLARDLFSQG